jgi:phosphoribosylaminoimidazolecarboxamide formyltransferase / IMP cyclohydrolase
MHKRALISLSDKTGGVEFARELSNLGYEIVSTGGTYKAIKEAGVAATYVSEVTGFPEILDGRVKTLHPMVHGGILAKGTPEHLAQLEANQILPIDIVAVNLYPFAKVMDKPEFTLEEAVENIDIGGPTMVRASAKNFERVTIIVNPENYGQVLAELKAKGEVSRELRLKLAAEAFTHTALYDRMISGYFQTLVEDTSYTSVFSLAGEKVQDLRYGENPHQEAAFYRTLGQGEGSLAYARQLQGKELSYNNLVDMNAAWGLVKEFSQPAAVIVKHTNPCGTAIAGDLRQAYLTALEADPVSAFGGIVALNREVDQESASEMVKLFLEVIVAPTFSDGALEILSKKQNLRLMAVGNSTSKQNFEVKQIDGGFLVQDLDVIQEEAQSWQVVSNSKPTEHDLDELAFAMKVCKHVKSNAITVSKNGQTLGVGAGQMNRVGSAGIALEQAGDKARGAYLASDAFFPFRDTVDKAAEAGIRAIVQPGGSLKDEESILAANEHGLIMVFTGVRHFKH